MKKYLSNNILGKILRYLLYVTVVLLVISVGVTLGKYTFTTNGSDSARVAKYSVSVECLDSLVETYNSGTVTLAPLTSEEYVFKISNENSEVEVTVSLSFLSVVGFSLPTYSLYDLGSSSTGAGTPISTVPFSFDLGIDEVRYVRILFTGSNYASDEQSIIFDVMTAQKQV